MSLPDLNLLITLEALLAEGSVAGAARRLQLSPSAMSRALARLRKVTGDPLLVRAGRDAPMAKALMIPPAMGADATMKQSHRDLFSYCNAVMEPWDGPAAVAFTDGQQIGATLDRNGLRPARSLNDGTRFGR